MREWARKKILKNMAENSPNFVKDIHFPVQ